MDHVSCCRFFSIASQTGRQAMQQCDPSSTLSGAGSFFLPFGNAPSDAPTHPPAGLWAVGRDQPL